MNKEMFTIKIIPERDNSQSYGHRDLLSKKGWRRGGSAINGSRNKAVSGLFSCLSLPASFQFGLSSQSFS